jgi:hypothetical protein
MLWDLLQQYQIGEAERKSQRAAHSANQAQSDTTDARRSLETLVLACSAMWELVRERDGLTDQMLLDRMREIDLRDGHADGKITSVPVTCPSCARLTGARSGRCTFCGATLPAPPSPFVKR